MELGLWLGLGAWLGLASGLGFQGIPGDYCKTRQPITCCTSRDDECTVPILGNHLCYCDMFCDDHRGHDCCPDFEAVCRGITPTPQVRSDCTYDGVRYRGGDRVQQNCNQCTCVGEGEAGRWQCEQNACMIQQDLLDGVNGGRYSWRGQNYSQYWGKTLDHGVRFRLGTLFPERSVQNMNEILIKQMPTQESFDSRTKWPGWIQEVRDQENCGSSWAFSTTATSADRLAIMSEGKLKADLSIQQLISCNQHRQKGCEGGYLDRAWWYIRKLGVVSERCYPYNSGRTNEPGVCQIPKSQYRRSEGLTCPAPSADAKIYKMTPPYRVSKAEADIMTEIQTNGPVQATFLVHEDFYMYAGGVYRHTDLAQNKGPQYRAEGYHSVRILGWGVDRSNGGAVKYWLCANSWGRNWGEQGLFRIVRGENHCQIESFVIGAWGKGQKKRRRRFKIRKLKRKRLRKFLL